MKRQILMLLGVALMVSVFAQQSDERVLVTIAGEPSTVSEFLYIYEKNNQEGSVEKKSIDEYLDMFINFKLKVAAARELGIDTTESFRKELAGYRAQAVPKYMVDQDAEREVFNKAYERLKLDRSVRHIAIRCPENSSAEEEKQALEKISRARQRVTTGLPVIDKKKKAKPGVQEDFRIVAIEMSEDPSVIDNEGLIGVVRPFRFVYSFEQAAYETAVGEVSEIFRTPFGFHILKVESEEPHKEVRCLHIMKMTPKGQDSIAAIAKTEIDSLYRLIANEKNDTVFEQLARKESEDRGSSARGGDLGYFSKGQMVPEFERTAFALQIGEISEPIKSQYGWHIIKKLDERELGSKEEIEAETMRQIHRSEYQREIDKQYTERLKKEYSLQEEANALDALNALGEQEQIGDSAYIEKGKLLKGKLFSIGEKEYLQSDLVEYINENKKGLNGKGEAALRQKYDELVSRELRAKEDSELENKHPELRNLMTEYHDGIMLFEVSLKEVWDKASTDTAGLRQFFEANKQNYKFDSPRYKGFFVESKDKKTAKIAKQIIKSANRDSVASYLNHRVNVVDSVKFVQFEYGIWKQGDHKGVDKYAFKQKKADFEPKENLPVVFVVGKKIKAAEEARDERGKVTSDYQDYLEKEWVKRLREKYEVKVDKEVFESLKQR